LGGGGGGKQRLAERIGHHLVLVAMSDEKQDVYAADAAHRIEAAASEQPSHAVVEARHVTHRDEGRDDDDGRAWPHRGQVDRHRAAQRLVERNEACAGQR
jgi:hypothetical protein